MRKIVKEGKAKQANLALEFHEFYTKFHHCPGTHVLVPGERNMPRKPSEHTRKEAAAVPALAFSATCSVCGQSGKLKEMRENICDSKTFPGHPARAQIMREARAAWKEILDGRRRAKVHRFNNAELHLNPSLLAFCATDGPRIGEARHPGP